MGDALLDSTLVALALLKKLMLFAQAVSFRLGRCTHAFILGCAVGVMASCVMVGMRRFGFHHFVFACFGFLLSTDFGLTTNFNTAFRALDFLKLELDLGLNLLNALD